MTLKTTIHATEGAQSLLVTRDFDLPVESLFKAFVTPHLFEQWMGTKVLKMDCQKHGAYHFETTDPRGNQHGFHGVFHDVIADRAIIRTFEMVDTPFPAQLEFLDFERTSEHSSRLLMLIVYKSVAHKDQMLQLPFAQGINFAHDRLEKLFHHTGSKG